VRADLGGGCGSSRVRPRGTRYSHTHGKHQAIARAGARHAEIETRQGEGDVAVPNEFDEIRRRRERKERQERRERRNRIAIRVIEVLIVLALAAIAALFLKMILHLAPPGG
jgi:hypothetical protein